MTDMNKCGAALVECFTAYFTVYHNNAAEHSQRHINKCQTSSGEEAGRLFFYKAEFLFIVPESKYGYFTSLKVFICLD